MSSILLLASLMLGLVEANPEKTFILPGGAEIEMVWIEPGTFWMGTTEEQEKKLRSRGMWYSYCEYEQPAHQVTITKGFYLGKYEITQEQWKSVMGTTSRSALYDVQNSPNNPAVHISCNDAQAFIAKLSEAEGGQKGICECGFDPTAI